MIARSGIIPSYGTYVIYGVNEGSITLVVERISRYDVDEMRYTELTVSQAERIVVSLMDQYKSIPEQE